MNKTLCAVRIDVRTIDNMKSAIKKYNKENIVSLTQSEFRRMALELLSQLILRDMKLPIKIN